MTRRPFAALATALALCAAVACSSGKPAASPSPSASSVSPSPSASPASVSPSPSHSPSRPPTASPAGAPCPSSYTAPDPDRPVVALAFTVAADKRSVTGTERVTFRPDLTVDRLVFRLWANGPASRSGGGSSAVSRVLVDGAERSFSTAHSGTLVSVPLPRAVRAGTAIVADLTFSLTLPYGVNERWGRSGQTVWFGSGFPLLAWERGRGWATEPPTSAFAEAATSESFRLSLSVDAPAGDVVLATGVPAGGSGRIRRRTADAVRDVMVAVGPFQVARGKAGDVPVAVGVAPGVSDNPSWLLDRHLLGIAAHVRRFGPFPYASLDVAVVPVVKGGIEFPAGILLGSGQDRDATLVHELGHEWFYGLVGDDQARDPWLDEAFATYAEALARGTAGTYLSTSIPYSGRNRVGAPMTYWESHRDAYYRSVYVQGAAALLRARAQVGAAAFDRAIRCYVAATAHRVARPADLARALAGLPAALTTLRRVGALPPG